MKFSQFFDENKEIYQNNDFKKKRKWYTRLRDW